MTKQFCLTLQQQELYCTANRKYRISQANSKTCNRDSVFTESLFVLYKNTPLERSKFFANCCKYYKFWRGGEIQNIP